MFTQPGPPSSSGFISPTTDPAAASSLPPATTRGSRLRGLSYLRSYTQNHLLSRDSGSAAQNSASGADTGASSQNQPLTRAATHSTIVSVSGRRRSRQSAAADDPLSNARDRFRRTTLIQNANSSHGSSHGPLVEVNSDSDTGRGKKHKTGTEGSDVAEQSTNEANMTRTRSATTGDLSQDMLPSIRFSAHYDPRSTRQSLSFTPLSRTLPTGKEIIKVGRYSEREQAAVIPANTPSSAPVGFKSKVVSRRHCEFWYEDGKWYIKDVKSSSGTFLNHIRLSPPGNESKPYVVNDGDIVQLGIDFRGGEEMIFRCVKMRIELNRGWQNKPNNFNMATHKRLRNLTSTDANATNATQDCSICLNAIAPCQSLFVAPCSHTWHYKCIRELLLGPSHPIFMCPNCRAAADLDADIEEPDEEWQQLDSGGEDSNMMDTSDAPQVSTNSTSDLNQDIIDSTADEVQSKASSADGEAGDVTMMLDHAPTVQEPPARPEASSPIPIPQASPIPVNGTGIAAHTRRTPSPPVRPNGEGPLTPRNDAGPWVFDGDAGRSSQDVTRPGAMVNLDAAATQVESNAS